MRSVYSTLTALRQLCDSLDLCLGMPTYIGPSKQAGGLLNKQGAVRTASDVAPCYRRVMLVAYLRVNHWADFDESYSDGKLSAAATPSNNAGRAITRCADWSRVKERKIVLSVNNSDG